MHYPDLLNQILALFIILFFGYYLRKKKFISESRREFLFDLLLDYILPFMIISAMMVDIEPGMLGNVIYVLLSWFMVYLLAILLSAGLAKFLPGSDRHKRTIRFLIIFSNVGYMGLPVLGAIFPEYGIFYGSIGLIPFNVVFWTYGAYLLQENGNNFNLSRLLKIFNNNGTIALGIGFLLLLSGFRPPGAVVEAVELIGDATFPLSMLVIGASLYGMSFKKIIIKPELLGLSLLKLVIFPLLIFLLLLVLPLDNQLAAIIAMQFAMPVAANSVIFASRFPGDEILASEGVFLTTLLALFTIPGLAGIITALF